MSNLVQKISLFFYVISFLILVVFIYLRFNYSDNPYRKEFVGIDSSMEPTLLEGDKLIVNAQVKPKLDDIVAFDFLDKNGEVSNVYENKSAIIKRITAINNNGCF